MGNNKGFTLVELIVALTLTAIISVTAIAVVAPIFDISRRVSDSARAQMVIENVLGAVRREISVGDEIAAPDDGASLTVDGSVIALDAAGYLTIGGERPFADKYYGDGALTLSFTVGDDGTVGIEAAVTQEGRTLAEARTSVVPIRRLLQN